MLLPSLSRLRPPPHLMRCIYKYPLLQGKASRRQTPTAASAYAYARVPRRAEGRACIADPARRRRRRVERYGLYSPPITFSLVRLLGRLARAGAGAGAR